MPLRLRYPAKVAARLARARAQLAEARAIDDTESASVVTYANQVAVLERSLREADRCLHCGRRIDDPVSVARGIGSTCWAKGAR